MNSPIVIRYRHLQGSSELDAQARAIGHRLLDLGRLVVQCRMTLDGPHDKCLFAATIELSLPGARIYADSRNGCITAASSMSEALAEAFADATRQLERLPVSPGSMSHLSV